MLALNIIVALVIAAGVWFAGSWALSLLIFNVETRDPRMAERTVWTAIETALTICVFVVAVAVWIALAYFFQQLSR